MPVEAHDVVDELEPSELEQLHEPELPEHVRFRQWHIEPSLGQPLCAQQIPFANVLSLHSVSFLVTENMKHVHVPELPEHCVVNVEFGCGGLPPSSDADPAHAAAHDARMQSRSGSAAYESVAAVWVSAHPSAFDPVEHWSSLSSTVFLHGS